eukprot:UN06661
MAAVTVCYREYHYTSWISKVSLITTLYGFSSWLIPGEVFAYFLERRQDTPAMCFMILQVFVLVDFAHQLHENLSRYIDDDNDNSNSKKAKMFYLGISGFSFIASIVGIIALYVKFSPCTLHTVLITITAIAAVAITGVSVSNFTNRGLLPPTIPSSQ